MFGRLQQCLLPIHIAARVPDSLTRWSCSLRRCGRERLVREQHLGHRRRAAAPDHVVPEVELQERRVHAQPGGDGLVRKAFVSALLQKCQMHGVAEN